MKEIIFFLRNISSALNIFLRFWLDRIKHFVHEAFIYTCNIVMRLWIICVKCEIENFHCVLFYIKLKAFAAKDSFSLSRKNKLSHQQYIKGAKIGKEIDGNFCSTHLTQNMWWMSVIRIRTQTYSQKKTKQCIKRI